LYREDGTDGGLVGLAEEGISRGVMGREIGRRRWSLEEYHRLGLLLMRRAREKEEERERRGREEGEERKRRREKTRREWERKGMTTLV